MTGFKAAEDLLAKHDVAGKPRRRPEIQDQTFWREKVMRAVDEARAGRIHGLMSWDPDLRNSLSAKPTVDPFAIDRKRFPTGPGGKLPRQIAYFLKPSPVFDPQWVPGQPVKMLPMRLVILESQLLHEDLLPDKLAVPGAGKPIEAHPSVKRAPDDVRTEIWLNDDVAKAIEKENFRILPVDPDKLFTGRNQTRAVKTAFTGVAVLPNGLKGCTRVIFTTSDWNLPLATTQGGETASHILKGRNTHVSSFIGQTKRLGILFVDGATATFRHREIFLPYDSIVTIVTVDPDPTKPGPATQRMDYSEALRKDPTTNLPSDILKRVNDTQTAFNAPTNFVTFETQGEFKKGKVTFNVTGKQLVLPPSMRQLDVVKADGTRVTVTYDPKQSLSALLSDLKAIHDSIEIALPREITTRLPPPH